MQPAPTPISLLPEAFIDLIDRTDAAETLMQAVTSKTPAELSGPAGIGKSALLRYLCPRFDPKTFASGIVYVERRGRDADDLLQFIFQAFYDAPDGYVAVGGRLLRYLQPLDALIVVDDANLDRDDLEHMRNVASRCTFVFARESAAMTDGKPLALSGLSEPDSVEVLERRLGRKLTPGESAAAHELWVQLAGNPLFLIQAAALVSGGHETMDDLESQLAKAGPADLAGAAVAALTPQQRALMTTLGGLGDAPVEQSTLGAIGQQPDAAALLKQLSESGLVQAHSPSFTAAANVKAVLGVTSDEVVDQVLRWSGGQVKSASTLEAAPVVEHAIESAARTGRWKDVITLVRHVEGVLAAHGRWGAWKSVLDLGLDAARKLGDVGEMGWALHQLGSRALALEDFDTAAELLGKALKARTGAGDTAGAEATQHNLTTLHSLSPSHAVPKNGHPNTGGGKGGIGGSPPWGLIVGLTAVALLAATGGVAYALNPSLIGSIVRPTNPATPSTPVTPLPPAITIDKAVPSVLGQGGTTKIEFAGSGFEQGMSVDLGQGIQVADVAVSSATDLLATIAAAPDAVPGRRDVVFTTQDSRHGTCSGCLTVSAAPSVSDMTPNVAGQGAVRRFVVTSLYLNEKTQIRFSGTGLVLSNTFSNIQTKQLTGTLTVDPSAPPGARDVTLTNPDAGTSTCTGCLRVTPSPVIIGVSPNPIYTGTTAVKLTGTGLTPGTAVQFADPNITVGPVTYNGPAEIDVNVTVASGTQPGPKTFTVTNPDGGRSQCDKCETLSVIM